MCITSEHAANRGFNSRVVALDTNMGAFSTSAQTRTAPQGAGKVALTYPPDFEGGMLVAAVDSYPYGLSLMLDQLWANPLSGVPDGDAHLESIC